MVTVSKRRRFLVTAVEVAGCVLDLYSVEVGECVNALASWGRGLRADNAGWRRGLVYRV